MFWVSVTSNIHWRICETVRKLKVVRYMRKTVIYGAQSIALGVYKSVKAFFPERDIVCFLVTEKGQNSDFLNAIPVIQLHEFIDGMSQEEKNEINVLISTPENVMDEIEHSLNKAGLYNHIRIDSLRWANMMQKFFVKMGEFLPLDVYPIGFRKASLSVYKVIHYKDKKLNTLVNDPEYMKTLQVGVCSTSKCIADFFDNEGFGISEKNRNYSELTGLYWFWKNQLQLGEHEEYHYYGLAHYRRRLQIREDDWLRLQDNEIDVVLPYPMPYEPNIEEHHKRYLSDSEWNAVLQALDELQPQYAEAFNDILKQEYLYNYNLILAKGKILDAYCGWLFPLLFRIEEINDPMDKKEPNRYIGYIGETLETLYFMYNKDKLKIAYTGCEFLV